MRRLLGALLVSVLATLGLAVPAGAGGIPLPTNPLGNPTGANDWDCKPTPQRPEPVIIVHGTFGDKKSLLDTLSATMVDDGYCVFSLDYGNRATRDIAASARELKRYTARVLAATGAEKVSMVGHSQGGMMPRYYIKFLGGGKVVDDLIGLSPSNHGTTIIPNQSGPGTDQLAGLVCVACQQQAAGSDFLARLNADDETPGPVSYTQISTKYDEIVVPYSSAFLAEGPRTTNITIQDACPGDLAEHGFIAASPTALAYVLNALGRPGPADPTYRPAC